WRFDRAGDERAQRPGASRRRRRQLDGSGVDPVRSARAARRHRGARVGLHGQLLDEGATRIARRYWQAPRFGAPEPERQRRYEFAGCPSVVTGNTSSSGPSHWPSPRLTTARLRFESTRTILPTLSNFGTRTGSFAWSRRRARRMASASAAARSRAAR